MSGVGGADQPPAKKLKSGDDTETGTVDKFGGSIEEEATALKKLKEAGFDPEKVNRTQIIAFDQKLPHITWQASPMVHFCRAGDLPMCRFLLAKGASITKASDDGWWFPMVAAVRGGQLHVCKWLLDNGAASNVGRRFGNDRSSLWYATRSGDEKYFEVGKWLILNGALRVSDGNEGMREVDANALVLDMAPRHYHLVLRQDRLNNEIPNVQTDTRQMYLSWADGAVADHRTFFTFLCGATLKAPRYSKASLRAFFTQNLRSAAAATTLVEDMPEEKQRRVWNDLFVLPHLAGNIGVLQAIADFLGILRGRELKIVRSLTVHLRAFIDDIPDPVSSDEESYMYEGTDGDY